MTKQTPYMKPETHKEEQQQRKRRGMVSKKNYEGRGENYEGRGAL